MGSFDYFITAFIEGLQPGVKMRVVGLVSGGKDSCYNLINVVAEGHELVALANLRLREDAWISWIVSRIRET